MQRMEKGTRERVEGERTEGMNERTKKQDRVGEGEFKEMNKGGTEGGQKEKKENKVK